MEDAKLRREILYLSALIQHHKKTEDTGHKNTETSAGISKQNLQQSPHKPNYTRVSQSPASVDYQSTTASSNRCVSSSTLDRKVTAAQTGKHSQSCSKYKWVAHTNLPEELPSDSSIHVPALQSNNIPGHNNRSGLVCPEVKPASLEKSCESSRKVLIGKNGVKIIADSKSDSCVRGTTLLNSSAVQVSPGINQNVKKNMKEPCSMRVLGDCARQHATTKGMEIAVAGNTNTNSFLKRKVKTNSGPSRHIAPKNLSSNAISSDIEKKHSNASLVRDQETCKKHNVQTMSSSSSGSRYKIDHRQDSPHCTNSPGSSPMKLDFRSRKKHCQDRMVPLSSSVSSLVGHGPRSSEASPHNNPVSKYKYVKPRTSPTTRHKELVNYHNQNQFKVVRHHPLASIQRKRSPSFNSPIAMLTRYKLVKANSGASTSTRQSGHKLLKKALLIAHKKRRSSIKSHGHGNERDQHTFQRYKLRNSKAAETKGKNNWTKRYSLRRSHSGNGASLDVNHLLGRSVSDKSKNKYKFIKGDTLKTRRRSQFVYHAGDAALSRKHLPSRGSMKIDRRCLRTRFQDMRRAANRKVLTSHVVGFSATGGRKPTQGRYKLVNHIVSRVPSRTQLAASLAVKRSLQAASTAHLRKRGKKGSQQLCLFFCRFGKCNRGQKCPYKHDPEKVAVCTRFLRGTCKVSNCPFSHKVSEDKMPVCSFFLRGVCSRDDCPYRHINVGRDAEPCMDFARGHCSLADKCTKKHVLDCPDHERGEKCPRGKKCPLRHRSTLSRRKRKRSRSGSLNKPHNNHTKARSVSPVKTAKRLEAVDDKDDIHLPMKERVLPSFIALAQNESIQVIDNINVSSDYTSGEANLNQTNRKSSKSKDSIIPKFLRK